MHSFELKTVVAAPPRKVFTAITDPRYILKWDAAAYVHNDMRLAGQYRKRDAEGRLTEGEIVVLEQPYRFGVVAPVLTSPDEPEEGSFPVRFEFDIEAHEDQSLLTLKATGFPTEELCARERNSWGGYFLEKLKKVAETR